MPNLLKQIKSIFFDKTQVLAPGLYYFQAPQESEYHYRLHLRIEPDGEGLLIINASTVLHLNQTATEYAYHLINQTPESEAIESVVKRYQISYADVKNDYENFIDRIETLINTPDLDPVTYLDFERSTPYIDFPFAPYRLDCALTYQLRKREKDGVTPTDRVKRELSFDEWKSILDKAWEAGIPHVIFTGGEPTLRPDLFDLIIEAENHGMVTGLSTDGIKLSENEYIDQLLASGLDHLLITFDPENEQSWEAIRNIIPKDIHTTVHVTVDQNDKEKYEKILTDLRSLGTENISLSYQNQNLENIVIDLRNKAAEMGLNLNWDLSVPYSQFNPVSSEIETTEPVQSGAGKAWLYIEPDGDTLPAQGINKPLGNFLSDSWGWIWSNAKLLNKNL